MDYDDQNEGASAPGANAIIDQNILKFPNGKEIQAEISLLETTSLKSSQYLNEYSFFYSTQKDNLMKEINNFRDTLISQYNQLNFNEKPSQKPSKFDTETDFISATERNMNLMKRINKIYSQIFDSIKQNMEILNKFLDKFIKYFHNIDEQTSKDKPVQDFLEEEFKNIVKSWLFMKIDFEKFDFEDALSKGEYEPNFKAFVANEFKKKF